MKHSFFSATLVIAALALTACGGGYRINALDNYYLEASLSRVNGERYPVFGFSQQWEKQGKLGVYYHSRWRAVELRYQGDYGNFTLMTDRVNFYQSSVFGLGFSIAY